MRTTTIGNLMTKANVKPMLTLKLEQNVRSMNTNTHINCLAEETTIHSAGELHKFLSLPDKTTNKVKRLVVLYGGKKYKFEINELYKAVEVYCQ